MDDPLYEILFFLFDRYIDAKYQGYARRSEIVIMRWAFSINFTNLFFAKFGAKDIIQFHQKMMAYRRLYTSLRLSNMPYILRSVPEKVA